MDQSISKLPFSPPGTFSRRPGCEDLGKEYEVKITALLALRALTHTTIQNVWIGSNVDEVGDFDDVVLFAQNQQNQSTAYLIQLKYKKKPKNITEREFFDENTQKGDFLLSKYSKKYLKLKDDFKNPSCEDDVVRSLKGVDEIVLVLYTNRGVNSNCDFLTQTSSDSFINTAGNENGTYKFKDNLEYDSEFLKQFQLYAFQAHITQVDELIKKELLQLLSSIALRDDELNTLIETFLGFIRKWMSEGKAKVNKKSKIFSILEKCDILGQIINFILKRFCVDLTSNVFVNTQYHLWKDIVRDECVTIVDEDKDVCNFLKGYVEAEIRELTKMRSWKDELRKEVFYETHPELKQILVKFVGNSSLTPMDVFQALWINNKIPLLLAVDSFDTFDYIKKTLQLSNYSFKVILIMRSEISVNTTNIPCCLKGMSDIRDEEQLKRLLNSEVRLQGRESPPLKNFINKDMYRHISCTNIIQILLNNFSIGGWYESLPEYFQFRSLSKIVFCLSDLDDVDAQFFIEDKDGERSVYQPENRLVSDGKMSYKLQYLDGNFYELKNSMCRTAELRKRSLLQPDTISHTTINVPCIWRKLDAMVNCDVISKLVIINAYPGMGKTELMKYVASRAPTSFWVLNVNLSEHYAYFDTIKSTTKLASAHLHQFNDSILSKNRCNNSKLSKDVFAKLVSKKRVVILLDGFDEISISYKQEVSDIAKALHEEGYALWITTRPVTNAYLEEMFDTISLTLKPFDYTDQETFLKQYYSKYTKENSKLTNEFIKQLLDAARMNFVDKQSKFTSLPLQCKLLADVFEADLENSIENKIISFNPKFDLIKLYKEFLNKKNQISCDRFGIGGKDMQILFEKYQELFALKCVFNENVLKDLNLEQQLVEYYDKIQINANLLQREGILVVHQKNSCDKIDISFVHWTFAEFVAAQWLANNYKMQKSFVIKKLLEDRFINPCKFVYKFFDLIVCEKLPLHSSIINENVKMASVIVATNSNALREVDKIGRTALHLISLYAKQHLRIRCGDKECFQCGMIDIIAHLPDNDQIMTKDFILQYTPLDYAIRAKSLAIANKFCQKYPQSKPAIHLPNEAFKRISLSYWNDNGYEYLDKTLNLHLFKVADQLFKDFCEPVKLKLRLYFFNYFPSPFKAKMKEFVRMNYSNDLAYVSAFGSVSDVKSLISHKTINKKDVWNNTPLHYAVAHNRLDIVELLVMNGSELNSPGLFGDTPLLIAAGYRYREMLLLLLKKGADINSRNKQYETSLSVAISKDYTDILDILINQRANIDTSHLDGYTPLHIACNRDSLEMLQKLLPNVVNINAQAEFGNTALHIVIENAFGRNLDRRIKMVQLLLEKGIDVNLRNDSGNTALHLICKPEVETQQYIHSNDETNESFLTKFKEFRKSVLALILQSNVKFEIRDKNGDTCLDCAEKNKQDNGELFALLQENYLKINK